jgi:hypothetical protein
VVLMTGRSSIDQRITFLVSLVATLAAATYSVITISIDTVPQHFPFGILMVLPTQYWVAVMFAVALLLFAMHTRVVEYVLIAGLILAVLVAGLGALFHPLPRDLYDVVAAERISRDGFFEPSDYVFLNFPGSAILFSTLLIVAGMGSSLTVRLFELLYNPLLVILGYASFSRLGLVKDKAVSASLILVFAFYLQGVLLATSLLGFAFYVLVFGLALGPHKNSSANKIMLILFFAAMVVSHAFTPFLTFGALAILLLGWKPASLLVRKFARVGLGGVAPQTNGLILAPLALILVLYWAYFAFLPLSWGAIAVMSTDLRMLLGTAVSPVVAPATVYARAYASVAELYLPLMAVGFLFYVAADRDKWKSQIMLWITGLASTLVLAVSGYVFEFFARTFALALLPMSYGIARLFVSNRRVVQGLALAVFLIALSLHIPAHYGQDSAYVVRDSTVVGLHFFGAHSSPGADLRAPIQEFRDPFYFGEGTIGESTNNHNSYYLTSYEADSAVLYENGASALTVLRRGLISSRYAQIYSNGDFLVYLENS